MCGVAGIAHWGTVIDAEKRIREMAGSLVHRGPDDEGYFNSADIALGFRRLSIVDLKLGQQPMVDLKSQVAIVFNGEIYNHAEIREELIRLGYKFKTSHSDTESILLGWVHWGPKIIEKLNGMFAIGIWDNRSRSLFLIRDRLGIKPLYYSRTADQIVIFGSEARALFNSGLVAKEPDSDGVYEYLSFQNNWDGRTPYKNVQQVPAGTILKFSNQGMNGTRFWCFQSARNQGEDFSVAVEKQRYLFEKAVKSQLQADVDISTYLSGGIDSGSITAIAAKTRKQTKAFTCLFDLDQVGDDKLADEREYSRAMAKHLNLHLYELHLHPRSLESTLTRVIGALEYPRMGISYANFLISEFVAKQTKVVLSGMGGDELFGGYVGRYRITPKSNVYFQARRSLGQIAAKIPRVGERLARNFVDPLRAYRTSLLAGVPSHEIRSALNSEFLRLVNFDAHQVITDKFSSIGSRNSWEIVLQVDLQTYLAGLLTLEDKLSMAHSLETRVPFLDNELIDFAANRPWQQLTDGDTGKIILREAVKPLVPQIVYEKPKMGFGPPDASWYRHQLREWVESQLSQKNIASVGIFNPAYIDAKLTQHFAGKQNNVGLIWTALSIHEWARQNHFQWN